MSQSKSKSIKYRYSAISHLCYGHYVFQSIGYSRGDSKFHYLIHGNFGDMYTVDGCQKDVALLTIHPCEEGKRPKYDIAILDSQFANPAEMATPISIIMDNWRTRP